MTTSDNSGPAAVLFGKTRRAVLSLLFGHTDEAFYLRQIVRATGVGLGPVQRELKRLADAGIIRRSVQGRRVYYQANADSPLFAGLKGLIETSVAASPAAARGANIRIPSRKLAALCQRRHIRKLSLFGSVLRDDFRPDSDVDVLVEFEPGHVPGLFALADMEAELSALFGRKVDLRTPQELSRYFWDRVIREARVQYAAAG